MSTTTTRTLAQGLLFFTNIGYLRFIVHKIRIKRRIAEEDNLRKAYKNVVYEFKRPERDTTDLLVCPGFTLFGLIRVVYHNFDLIVWNDWFNWISLFERFKQGVTQSILSIFEWIFYRNKINQQELDQSPVFIIGSYRTGTTLMQHLLSANDEKFHYFNGLAMNLPSSFLLLSKEIENIAKQADRPDRIVDKIPYKISDPQEDHFAVAQLTGVGHALSMIFPRAYKRYRPHYCLENENERRTWKDAFIYMLKKVTILNDPECKRRLVLKSPPHVCKIPVLLELFPKAQFVFLNRDPIHLFFSTARLYETFVFKNDLTGVTDILMQDFIIQQYKIFIQQYKRTKELIPKGNLIEVDYEDLSKNKLGTVAKVYKELGWEWDTVSEMYESHPLVNQIFQKNSYDKNASQDVLSMLADVYAEEIRFYKNN